MEGHRVLAGTLFFIPDFAAAKSHSEQAIALYDKEQRSARAELFPNPPGLVCRLLRSHILWILGYADQAREQCYEALSLARELSHPSNIIYALAWTSTLHQFRQEAKETQAIVEEELILLSEQRIPVWQGAAAIVQQWALAMQGRQAGAIEGIHEGLATYRASGSENMRSYLLSMLAEVGAVSGQITEGQRAISEALIGVEDSGIRYHEAELHRLKGELLLLSKVETPQVCAQKEAETCFHRAIYIAQRQKAKYWELRATMSLARVWQQQGKGAEARQMLSGIYNWFTEGFDTADLKDAKALLEELSD
jgi:predicted ATPase